MEAEKIVTGKPLFGIDYKVEETKYAGIVHPPVFGMKVQSFDASSVLRNAGNPRCVYH